MHPGPIEFERDAVRQRRAAAQRAAGAGAGDPRRIPTRWASSALQDLGDVTLQAHLGAASPAEHKALYRQAVSLIETLQRRGAELASPDYPAVRHRLRRRQADVGAAVLREALPRRLPRRRRWTAAAREALAAEFSAIAEELAAEPRVLCHRDYHSRNLMLHEGSLYIIDFQDARMGPDTYDLVSLLRDSYVDFTEAEVDDLIAFFLALRRGPGADGGRAADDQEFRRRFDLMAVQRNLKALGTFGYPDDLARQSRCTSSTSRGRSTTCAPTSSAIRASRRLRELLAEHLEELRQ